MLFNPLSPIYLFKVTSLKATIILLLILLLKSNLLRLKGGLIGGLFALILISGVIVSSSVALGSLFYAYQAKKNSDEDNSTARNMETVNI